MKFKEFSGKDQDEALSKALSELKLNEDDIFYSFSEKKGGLFKGTTTIIKVFTIEDVVEYIKDYLRNIITNMGLEVTFESKVREKQISIKMFSNNNSILIGKEGQTLKALQTIVKQVLYNEIEAYPHFLLDVENYKDKKNYYLEKLAKNLAKEVVKTKVEVVMDNMNSYERRIVHNILTDFKGVTTSSEGEEPNRHVVIKPNEE